MTESILQEAQRLIHGDRNKNYGHPRDNFKNIADLWTAYLGWEIKPMDVGLMMILLKVARLETGNYHRDSVADIAGYAGTLERIFEEPVEQDADAKGDKPLGSWIKNPKSDTSFTVNSADEVLARVQDLDAPKPRVWESLTDIPENVAVNDKGGWEWVKRAGILYYTRGFDQSREAVTQQINTTNGGYGPFIEVVA